jgi:hypothetical protein
MTFQPGNQAQVAPRNQVTQGEGWGLLLGLQFCGQVTRKFHTCSNLAHGWFYPCFLHILLLLIQRSQTDLSPASYAIMAQD